MINLVKCNKIHATKYGYILYEGRRTKKMSVSICQRCQHDISNSHRPITN